MPYLCLNIILLKGNIKKKQNNKNVCELFLLKAKLHFYFDIFY